MLPDGESGRSSSISIGGGGDGDLTFTTPFKSKANYLFNFKKQVFFFPLLTMFLPLLLGFEAAATGGLAPVLLFSWPSRPPVFLVTFFAMVSSFGRESALEKEKRRGRWESTTRTEHREGNTGGKRLSGLAAALGPRNAPLVAAIFSRAPSKKNLR